MTMLLLDLLTGLPKKEIWADRCAQNGHKRRGVSRIELQFRNNEGAQGLAPRDVSDDDDRNICEQRQRPPFENG